jgi:hypothetical protein
MSRPDTALAVIGSHHSDGFAGARPASDPVFLHSNRGTLTGFVNGMCKILLTLAVLGIVTIGGVITLREMELTAEARSTALVTTLGTSNPELAGLRAEMALLTEQSSELRSELVMLTGQGGVLPKLVERLQEQRRINAAHANALRQLYGTTDLISASLPTFEESAANESVGSRPVQVTPVTRPAEEAPKRVVLIPEDGDPEVAAGNSSEGDK